MEINKILVANRGEIACRIISTLKKLGKTCVAVYSDFDVGAKHVYQADESICLGGTALCDSYNNLEAILNACKKSGADAVHPGYGFMAENAEFARELEKIGIEFIGPSADCIEKMGDKVEAKKIASQNNVNLVPGYIGEVRDFEHTKKIVSEIGFPVLIKAAAGGGGKGMRVVNEMEELQEDISSAQSEALNSFKDSRVFIEKYIQRPRHIEIQILADKYGNAVCLGERECSLQRRHQKVIEEAPSPFVDKALRAKMYDQSLRLARSVGYYSVGTVEYIVDQEKNFYFMEMNTRIQVEHTVTEMITGIDLVEEMLRVAEGKKLRLKKNKTTFNGWAFESRVYAEDPTKNFLPTSGFVTECRFCDIARIESSIQDGTEVGMFYDPMVVKICVHDKTRELAIEKMRSALSDTAIIGLVNNLSFLESVFYNTDFIAGNIDTHFIQNYYGKDFYPQQINNILLYNITGVAAFVYFAKDLRDLKLGLCVNRNLTVEVNNKECNLECTFSGDQLSFCFGKKKLVIQSDYKAGQSFFVGKLNKKGFRCRVLEHCAGQLIVEYHGITAKCIVMQSDVYKLKKLIKKDEKVKSNSDKVRAQITGKLVKFYVEPGDKVAKGNPLFVIEAMKMQNTFTAERDGIVLSLQKDQGASTTEGDLILMFKK